MLKKLIRQIRQKRNRCKETGTPCMTEQQFLDLALASRHCFELGVGKNKYHWCRRDHSIGYTPENTFIGLASHNIRERIKRCGMPKRPRLPDEERIQRRHETAKKSYWKHREKRVLQKRLYRQRKRAADTLPITKKPITKTAARRLDALRRQRRAENRQRKAAAALQAATANQTSQENL